MSEPITADPRPLTGEPLGLDLLNTAWRDADGAHDLLAAADGMALWLTNHGLEGPTGPRARAALVEARESLRDLLEYPHSPRARERVNAVLRRGAERPILAGDRLERELDAPAAWRAPWRAARDLVTLRAQRPDRIRRCANPDCVLYFLDTSRPGTRRWCSMSACGNRDKTRRHYERNR